MSKFYAALLGAVLALPVVVSAAIDETIRVKESIEINAPADKVWGLVGNFGDLGSWHPAIAKTEITSGNKDEVGATRVLTLQDGGKINETLTARDAAGMTIKYEITESVLPLREYSATIVVQAKDGKTVVTWKSMFKRKDPAHEPKAGEDDKTAKDTITSIFKTGLENLKKVSEK